MPFPRAVIFGAFALSFVAAASCEGSTHHTASVVAPRGDASTLDGASMGGQMAAAGSGSMGAGGTPGTSGGTTGQGGTPSSGDSGPFVPPNCANPNQQLPADAPALTAGTWTPVSASIPFAKTPDVFAQGMAIDPCNAATLYLCVCQDPVDSTSGLYRSINAGTTWTKIGPMDQPNNVRVDPENPLHIYASDGVRGRTLGFWVTTDGGKTWAVPDAFQKASDMVHNNNDVYHIDPDPSDFNHVLLSFHSYWSNGDTAGVFESFDGGTTFSVVPIPDVHGGAGYDIFFLFNPSLGLGDNKTWLYATQTVGYYRTTDSGKTWKKATADGSMAHGGSQLYFTKDKVIYMGGDLTLRRSTDDGATWTSVGPRDAYIGIVGDGTNLYTAGNNVDKPFVFSPEKDGVTWTNFNTQISHSGPFEMAYDATNGIVYSANIFDGILALKVK